MKLTKAAIRILSAVIITIVGSSHLYSSPLSAIFENIQDTVRTKNSPKQPVYTTSRLVTAKPFIDGKLDDECWKNGTWAGNFTQWIPNEGAKPTYPTELNIQYDDKNLYVAIRAFDGEPGKILRQAGVRDELVGDMAGVNFDSYRDYRTGFEFTVTAWGQKVDLILFNPMNWDFNWNPVWKIKTGLEDSAWVAEYEIPLSQLRYSRQDEQVWGMHVWRWISRLQEESDWEIQSKTGPGMLYNFGGNVGLDANSQLKHITDPAAKIYGDRFELYQNPVISDGSYQLYDYTDGPRIDYSIDNPDFNFHEFRSNLVAKWEYRLGSFIYLVWSSERSGNTNASHASIGDSYKQLGRIFPNNIFLIKLNYWFSL